MGLISGSMACTRFNVIGLPETPDFDLIPFRPIMPGSSIREREGFVPYEPGEAFEISARKWAFRIRVDKVVPDSTSVSERVKELVKIETDNVGPPSMKQRQQLKLQAEDEIMQHPMPRSRVIECQLEETVLYVGSTAKGHLGLVLELLKRIGVELDFKTPWLDAGQEEELSDLVELKEPGQSILGCQFLRKLLDDPETIVEPEKGGVKLVTTDGVKVSLSGPVHNEVDRMLNNGAEILSAKLLVEGFAFNLDGLAYRITGLALENHKNKHWTEQLDLRMEKVKQLWEWLDTKYQLLMMTE